jgi:hypothetical protein
MAQLHFKTIQYEKKALKAKLAFAKAAVSRNHAEQKRL